MTELYFTQMIVEVFAAFGKREPTQRIRDAVFRRIANLPDSFLPYAQKRLEDMDSLPQNLGRYLLRELWYDFLDENPRLRAAERSVYGCAECGRHQGTIYAFRQSGSMTYEYALDCVCKAGMTLGWTRERAVQAGYTLRPEAACFSGKFPMPAHIARAIGHTEGMRAAHFAQMEDMGEDMRLYACDEVIRQ